MVRILTGAAAGVRSSLVMPTQAEKAALTKIVYRHYPKLDPANDSDYNPGDAYRNREAFHYAFFAVGQLGRLAEPEHSNPKSAGWWCGHLKELLQGFNIDSDVRVHVFIAALLAHGDIQHCFPKELRFGLTIGTGIPATDKWRRVIETGNLVPATPVNWPEYRPAVPRLDPFSGAPR